MEREEFEKIVESAFDLLPEKFYNELDNVSVVVEDYPADEIVRKMKLRSKRSLLGLYRGIPKTQRGTWYGMSAVVPDVISLYQKNIEAICNDEEMLKEKIREVLIHEIAHYFGMNEEEIKNAGY
ncbi:MAG: metallopeptidase family protein [Ignavibacteriales bacterium]|nr:metallopeptidase family protein [Ignavibacteriales bacterium]